MLTAPTCPALICHSGFCFVLFFNLYSWQYFILYHLISQVGWLGGNNQVSSQIQASLKVEDWTHGEGWLVEEVECKGGALCPRASPIFALLVLYRIFPSSSVPERLGVHSLSSLSPRDLCHSEMPPAPPSVAKIPKDCGLCWLFVPEKLKYQERNMSLCPIIKWWIEYRGTGVYKKPRYCKAPCRWEVLNINWAPLSAASAHFPVTTVREMLKCHFMDHIMCCLRWIFWPCFITFLINCNFLGPNLVSLSQVPFKYLKRLNLPQRFNHHSAAVGNHVVLI